MSSYEEIKKVLEDCQQSHLLKFWPTLTSEERENFLRHLSTINFKEVQQLFVRAKKSLSEDVRKLDDWMDPIPPAQFESEKNSDAETIGSYRRQGLNEIAESRVAVLLLAGGQGTRLGVSHPKGMYSVGLPSGKTLFQIQAERIRRVVELARLQYGKTGQICWYIMTSGPTNKETQEFLKKHNYFGLDPKNVVLFQQGLLPCFDFEGKILLDDKNVVALSPDGNGGIYRALAINGILKDMEQRGIKYVHVHSVDNILTKVADPVFIGYCVSKDAHCGAKVVKKASPDEAVGVVCKVNGCFQVVEYSEISKATSEKVDEFGNLVFSAGNICNHFFTTNFLKLVATEFENKLKLHVAKKKIPYINDNGDKIKPSEPNGIKIEKFVFDVFQFTHKFVTWEVPRTSEFSAMKNADSVGKDCPATAKRDLLTLHKSYIENAGGKVNCKEIEISPLLSYAGEDLEDKVKGKEFNEPTVLTADEEQAVNGHNGVCNGLNGKNH